MFPPGPGRATVEDGGGVLERVPASAEPVHPGRDQLRQAHPRLHEP